MRAQTNVAYANDSRVSSDEGGTVVELFANLLRGPAAFHGFVTNPIVFRDVLLTLGAVARSRLYRSPEEIREAILDPLVTVTEDAVFLECFSIDESTYARVKLGPDAFVGVRRQTPGCTNIEFSSRLTDQLSTIRRRGAVGLEVAREGVGLATPSGSTKERKIELPGSWMHGFLEVQAALRMPAQTTIEIGRRDLSNIIAQLKGRKAKSSPRGLVFELAPGQPPVARFEPWDHRITLGGSRYTGATETSAVLWGRRRLLLLQQLTPRIRNLRCELQGLGRPSFWHCDLESASMLLGLSPWTAAEWTRPGVQQLFSPPAEPCTAEELDAAAEAIEATDGSLTAIVDALEWSAASVERALDTLCRQGRALFDPETGRYHRREVFDAAPPAPPGLSGREDKARRLVAEDRVTVEASAPDARGVVRGDSARYRVEARVEPDDRLRSGSCECRFFTRNSLGWGPCSHILALRLKAGLPRR